MSCHSLLQVIKARSPVLQADSLPSEPPGKPQCTHYTPLISIPFKKRNTGNALIISQSTYGSIWKALLFGTCYGQSGTSLVTQMVKEPSCNVGDLGSILELGRSPREGNGNPLHYSCLENPMDRGAWRATVHGVAKSHIWLSNFALPQHQRGYSKLLVAQSERDLKGLFFNQILHFHDFRPAPLLCLAVLASPVFELAGGRELYGKNEVAVLICNFKKSATSVLFEECSNYWTIALISHASKGVLKILQARL